MLGIDINILGFLMIYKNSFLLILYIIKNIPMISMNFNILKRKNNLGAKLVQIPQLSSKIRNRHIDHIFIFLIRICIIIQLWIPVIKYKLNLILYSFHSSSFILDYICVVIAEFIINIIILQNIFYFPIKFYIQGIIYHINLYIFIFPKLFKGKLVFFIQLKIIVIFIHINQIFRLFKIIGNDLVYPILKLSVFFHHYFQSFVYIFQRVVLVFVPGYCKIQSLDFI